MIIIICGVSGSGKSTIGRQLADVLALDFHDADDFHPPANILKLRKSLALTDEDRMPWLTTLNTEMIAWNAKGGAVLACSALKERYRQKLSSSLNGDVRWVVLHGDEKLLLNRLEARQGHFVGPGLLASQLRDFEVPDYGYHFNIKAKPAGIVSDVQSLLTQKKIET